VTTVDPSNGQALHSYPVTTRSELSAAVHAAATIQRDWSRIDLADRARVLRSTSAQLAQNRDRLALLITREMGKPIREALTEVDKCAAVLDYYAESGERFLADEINDGTDADQSWVSFDPLGVILGIMPWNYPLWQVFRFAAPALMAGNAVLLKHAANTTGCALAIQNVLIDAGLPPGVLTALVIAEDDVPSATAQLVVDPRIAAVTLTGSERAGSAVAAIAGRAIKKCVLELGGSDPFVVLADADLERVAAHAVRARFLNAGQSCISPKRLIVEQPVATQFTRLVVEAAERLKTGDPEKPDTDIGPLARRDLRDAFARQVQSSIEAGAVVLAGGYVPSDGTGNYYLPTVLGGVRPGMPAYDEEMFGPVASIITVNDVDHAVAIANDTPYGLGASVWSSDLRIAGSVGRRITSGACFVNAPVTSDPRVPFGGTKRSGYGRELGRAGIREFVNARTWWVMDTAREL
jgi:succinate-semialdehyde dehydrogenase / glutarate-semialdehyde dehydrogenase